MKILRRTNAQDHLTVKGKPIANCKSEIVIIRVNATDGECANHYNRVEFTYSELKQIFKTVVKFWFINKFKLSSRNIGY